MICERCMQLLIDDIRRQKKERIRSVPPSFFDSCTNFRKKESNDVHYSLCSEQIEKAWDAIMIWIEKSSKKSTKYSE